MPFRDCTAIQPWFPGSSNTLARQLPTSSAIHQIKSILPTPADSPSIVVLVHENSSGVEVAQNGCTTPHCRNASLAVSPPLLWAAGVQPCPRFARFKLPGPKLSARRLRRWKCSIQCHALESRRSRIRLTQKGENSIRQTKGWICVMATMRLGWA